MTALTSLWKWLFRDKRSAWEIKQEREFIEAVNGLKNYTVTDRGGVSMDPEEIRDYVIARRQELSHLVDPKHRERPSFGTGHVSGPCVEVVSWRRLSDQAAIRYVCLQALDGSGFSVASARYISVEDPVSSHQDEEGRIAQRLMGVTCELAQEWHPTLAAALEAHDRAI
ncbi:hypothetical protein [Pseudomonas sp. 25571]|uniref:hypothetical protein n=1 Tax=Pseudomonas sp. 25571 TaxID=2967216 RepID=UPI002364512A|nr:hypothetical protein [Pseudomonas sp. 25571]MDD2064519.1 hypothetical protein [Pseudomonas sp. 25571]